MSGHDEFQSSPRLSARHPSQPAAANRSLVLIFTKFRGIKHQTWRASLSMVDIATRRPEQIGRMIPVKGQRKTQDPCLGCYLHRSLCICDLIPRLELKTRVALIVHTKELKRTTNTGRLAIRALMNSEMRVRGEHDSKAALDLSDLLSPNYQTFLFFGILFALIELFLGERKAEGRIWKGRFEIPQQ